MARRVSLQGRGAELFFGPDKAPRTSSRDAGNPPLVEDGRGARVHARTGAGAVSSDEQLFRGLSDKQRLASSTFRFQPEELERLDLVCDELNRLKPKRVSKNDVVRLGLRWLLADYEASRGDSVLSRLLARV